MKTKLILPAASIVFAIIYWVFETIISSAQASHINDYFLIGAFILFCVSMYEFLDELGNQYILFLKSKE